jgi:hypothetical protein
VVSRLRSGLRTAVMVPIVLVGAVGVVLLLVALAVVLSLGSAAAATGAFLRRLRGDR